MSLSMYGRHGYLNQVAGIFPQNLFWGAVMLQGEAECCPQSEVLTPYDDDGDALKQ